MSNMSYNWEYYFTHCVWYNNSDRNMHIMIFLLFAILHTISLNQENNAAVHAVKNLTMTNQSLAQFEMQSTPEAKVFTDL